MERWRTVSPAEVMAAARYTRRIRNTEKKRYAMAYAASKYIAGAPEPDSSEYSLGSMARQAVRMEIDRIFA